MSVFQTAARVKRVGETGFLIIEALVAAALIGCVAFAIVQHQSITAPSVSNSVEVQQLNTSLEFGKTLIRSYSAWIGQSVDGNTADLGIKDTAARRHPQWVQNYAIGLGCKLNADLEGGKPSDVLGLRTKEGRFSFSFLGQGSNSDSCNSSANSSPLSDALGSLTVIDVQAGSDHIFTSKGRLQHIDRLSRVGTRIQTSISPQLQYPPFENTPVMNPPLFNLYTVACAGTKGQPYPFDITSGSSGWSNVIREVKSKGYSTLSTQSFIDSDISNDSGFSESTPEQCAQKIKSFFPNHFSSVQGTVLTLSPQFRAGALSGSPIYGFSPNEINSAGSNANPEGWPHDDYTQLDERIPNNAPTLDVKVYFYRKGYWYVGAN